jgi:hypothetical protein
VSECGPHGRARHSADRGAATQCRRGMRTLPSSPCAAGRARAGAKVSSCARTAQARSICAGVNPCGGPIRIWKWIGVLRVRSRVEFEGLRRDTNMGLRQRGSWPTDGGVASEGRSLRSRRRHRLVYSGGSRRSASCWSPAVVAMGQALTRARSLREAPRHPALWFR